MEQKKTLWIIAAVGAFLLVVLGAAGLFYSPARNPVPTIASVSPVEKHNSNGWTTPSVQANVTEPTKVNDLVVLSDNTTIYEVAKADNNATTIDLNALKQELNSTDNTEVTAPVQTQPQNINITVNVPDTAKETVVYSTENIVTKTAEVPAKVEEPAPVKKTTAVASKPVETQKTVVKASAKPAAKTTTTPAVTKAEPKKTQFWVQVAAYSNKKGAEGARSVLTSNKIPSDIFTYKDNKDKLFYRVRVGPYTTKSEAEYWRSRIINIDTFAKAESYVTSTTN